jgi:hypothetical protein
MGDGADDALDYLSDLDDAHYRGDIDEETGQVVPSPFSSLCWRTKTSYKRSPARLEYLHTKIGNLTSCKKKGGSHVQGHLCRL